MQIEMLDAAVSEADLVDNYVLACAEAAASDARKEEAKQALLDSGLERLTGTLNKVKVSICAGRNTVNTKQMVLDGVISESLLQAYTSASAPYQRITVSAL